MTQEERTKKVEYWMEKAETMLNEYFSQWIQEHIVALRDDELDNQDLQEILFNTLNYNLARGRALQVKDHPEQWDQTVKEICEHLEKQFRISLGWGKQTMGRKT